MAGPRAHSFRELTTSAADRVVLRRFYDEVYTAEFPDPDERESLANIEHYLELKAAGGYGLNGYHVLVVESAGDVVAGAVADYLADPNAGVIEFLVVAPACRGRRLGRRLLDRIETLIVADARHAHGRQPGWIVAEINDPYLVDLAADNLDAFVRARIWGRWGYHKLDFPYIQPALSESQRPVRHLLLAAKLVGHPDGDALPTAAVLETLQAYLRWAMRIPEPEANAEYRAMRDYLETLARVPLVGLDRYVGDDPARPVLTSEVTREGDDLDAVLRVYRQAFSPGASALDAAVLQRRACAERDSRSAGIYHLWAIRAEPGASIAGMASFFSLPGIGFGGYIALDDALRGRGRLRLIVARIEEQMRRDGTDARGWLIECAAGSHALRAFSRLGFREIAFDYRPPPLRGAAPGEAPPLSLAYKDFGAVYAPPSLTRTELGAALLSVYGVVYGLDAAERSRVLRDLEATMDVWSTDTVEWRVPLSWLS